MSVIFIHCLVILKLFHLKGTPAKADALQASSPAAPAAPAGGPPAPPPPAAGPPPPPPPSNSPATGGDDGEAGRTALFAQLNQGTDITKGLLLIA